MTNTEGMTLRREIGLAGAVLLGLGSIVGTGVFVSIAIAAGVAGAWVVPALALAALVAVCNGLSSAQLAAAHPVSGGTYEYGYRLLHPRLGFAAGWLFLCAKSASAATAALGFAGYLLSAMGRDASLLLPIALGLVVVLTGVVLAGMRPSKTLNAVVVSISLGTLLFFVLAGLPKAADGAARNLAFFGNGMGDRLPGFLHASALMFVAYTGYGRIATLGEEVHEPQRTIPRAIVATLIVTMIVYVTVALVGVAAAGAESFGVAGSELAAPLEIVARTFEVPLAGEILALGAVTAMVGVLLNLVLGLSRVLLAMGRRKDMPPATARLSAGGTPVVAVAAVGAIVAGLVGLGDVKTTWSFSAFTVLIYYALTNAAALRLPPEARRFPRALAWLGLLSCFFLAFWIEPVVWLSGLGLLALGLLWQQLAFWITRRTA